MLTRQGGRRSCSVLLVTLSLGCGSIMSRGYLAPDFPERKPPPYFYRGVAAHLANSSENAGEPADAPAWVAPLGVVATAFDLSLCLVADTLLLPVDFFVWMRRPPPTGGDEPGAHGNAAREALENRHLAILQQARSAAWRMVARYFVPAASPAFAT